MASSSSTPAAILSSPLGLPISEKLSKNNLQLWKLQVLPAIRGAQLLGYLDGSEVAPDKEIAVIDENKKEGKAPNPEYARWVATDQQVLSYLLSSMTKEVMLQVGAAATTSAGLWAAVDEIFSSQTRARAVNTRIAMANLKKNNMSAEEYVGKMKALADELAAVGKPLGEDELVSYVLTGLDADYTPIVASLTSRREPVTYNELLSQIQSFESRLDLVHGINGGSGSQSSVNSATRSGGGVAILAPLVVASVDVAATHREVVAVIREDVVVAMVEVRDLASMEGVKSASRKGTAHSNAGIASILIMFQMKETSMQPCTLMVLTQTGTRILVLQIT